MQQADILIDGGLVVTMGPQRRMIANGAVAIAKGRILDVGKAEELRQHYQPAEVIDATGMMIAPGFIDAHNHSAHFLSKGLLDDIALPRRWATRLYPFDTAVSAEQTYWGSLGTFAEMIRSGTNLHRRSLAATTPRPRCGLRSISGCGPV